MKFQAFYESKSQEEIKIYEEFICLSKRKEILIKENKFQKLEIPDKDDIEAINQIAKENFNSLIKSFLGSGVFGWSFELQNGKVIKFTTDESEALNAQRLVGKKTRNLINYYKVIRLKSTEKIKFGIGTKYIGYTEYGDKIEKNKRILKGFDNSYIILMDKIDRLPAINKKILNEYWSNHTTYAGIDEESKIEILKSSDDELRNICLMDLENIRIWNNNFGWQSYTSDENKKNNYKFIFIEKNKLKKIINIMFDITKIYQELWYNKITTTDIHHENMGIKDGKMNAFDFGFTDERYNSNLIDFDSSYKDEYNNIKNYYIE